MSEVKAKECIFSVRSKEQLGAAFLSLRKMKKISQVQLSDLTGIRQSTISGFELGKIAIQIDSLFRLLNALEVEFFVKPRSRKSEI